jgi:hypothetical protein
MPQGGRSIIDFEFVIGISMACLKIYRKTKYILWQGKKYNGYPSSRHYINDCK